MILLPCTFGFSTLRSLSFLFPRRLPYRAGPGKRSPSMSWTCPRICPSRTSGMPCTSSTRWWRWSGCISIRAWEVTPAAPRRWPPAPPPASTRASKVSSCSCCRRRPRPCAELPSEVKYPPIGNTLSKSKSLLQNFRKGFRHRSYTEKNVSFFSVYYSIFYFIY